MNKPNYEVELNVADSKSIKRAVIRDDRVVVRWNYGGERSRGRYLDVPSDLLKELENSHRPSEFIRANLKNNPTIFYESF